jgi:hypothetical protein
MMSNDGAVYKAKSISNHHSTVSATGNCHSPASLRKFFAGNELKGTERRKKKEIRNGIT